NPPNDFAGMRLVRVDLSGRLLTFLAAPPEVAETPGPWGEPNWAPLFVAAGLKMDEWQPAEPGWSSSEPSDTRRAWTKGPLRIEAASMWGRPVQFGVKPEWVKPPSLVPRDVTVGERIAEILNILVPVLVIVAGALLARR